MRWIAAALVLSTGIAHADDPRDAFGIPRKQAEPPVDCTTGQDFGCATATDPFFERSPYALATWLSGKYLLSLPTADATHDQVAHYAMGAGSDEGGPIFAGATGLENRWTVEGAPTESLRNGVSETHVPLAFLDGILVTAGGFSARDRASTGGAIDARLKTGGKTHELDAYAWLGWDAPGRHPEIADDTYQVRRGTVDPHTSASAAIVATGPFDALGALVGGRAWYAAGVAPSVSVDRFQWTAATLVDADQDGIPDGAPGQVKLHVVERNEQSPTSYSIPAMARAGFDRGPHHADLTLLGSLSSGYFALYNSTLQAAGVDTTAFVGDAIATYRGEWQDTHLRAQLAWHHASRWQSARDSAAANQPQLLTAYVPTSLPEDPALAGACDDTALGDPYPKIPNCPVPQGYFASGGAGELVDTTADRPSITVDAAHALGHHVARIGATGEDSLLVSDSRFTGGSQIRSLFSGEQSVREFIAPDQPCSEDLTKPCPTVPVSELSYRTRYTAAYVEDTWHPAPDLTVDGGLRWELMWVGTQLHFSKELAPRFGATWDPLGGGRSRVWVSAGRSFAMLPAGLGQTVTGVDRTVDTLTSPFGASRSIQTGAPILVLPGVRPVAQDEVTAGAEVALLRAVRARAWAQGRQLVRGLELTAEGLDNPGRTGAEPDATRSTALVAFELATAPTAKLVLRAGYTYARTFGSWVGPYDPREGAVLYASPDFEVPSTNLAGPLPTDLGHRFYIEAERRGRVGSIAWQFATRLAIGSGRPRDVLIDGEDGLTYVIPRGEAGRNAAVQQANIRLAASWRGWDATLDVFNLFDQRTPTFVDALYASGGLRPIQGGSYSDLVWLKDGSGTPAARQTTYELGLGFQAPLAIVLGVHHAL